jgi:hypothetical protein
MPDLSDQPDQFRVLINLEHAELDSDFRNHALARLLEQVAEQLRHDVTGGNLRDINGRPVGDFGIRINGTLP